ncbi:MAG: hypothetical protein M0C28_03940 [Candidatus Moduliflexus flocculans]|nr:hypothetical protein [Candidatus Moduliflexus flocculans]
MRPNTTGLAATGGPGGSRRSGIGTVRAYRKCRKNRAHQLQETENGHGPADREEEVAAAQDRRRRRRRGLRPGRPLPFPVPVQRVHSERRHRAHHRFPR